jgi:hypothetical protein
MKSFRPANWLESVPDDPFYQPRKPLWLPREMATAPALNADAPRRPVELRQALLINPFYAKSPHGSFGKHVLTPTLALTSVAAATPAHWRVRYWDENLARAHKRTPKAADYARRVGILHEHGIQVNGSFVLGFDGDRHDVFGETAEWIESNRLECATFHILTPYPGTPLFRQMEAEGRLLHRNWDLYDTAHVVFRPKHLTPDELLLGYDWMYRRLFSHASIWQRRPQGVGAMLAYLAGAYLYKRSNRLWHFLIKRRLVRTAWRPIVELTRLRHLAFRRALAKTPAGCGGRHKAEPFSSPFPASV